LCRSKAYSDLELSAPFDKAAVGFAPVPERGARVTGIAPAGAGAIRLVLQYEDDSTHGRAAEFIPGQFMELTLPGTSITRAYSLANTPNWDGTLEFLIRLHPQGVFSGYLRDSAKIGDLLLVKGPQGSFTVDEASQSPRWFVAGGTGVAPMLSMLRQMVEFGVTQEARLFFGVNTEDELFASDAVEELSLPRLRVTFCVWKPGPNWTGFAGTPAEALTAALADGAARPDIYACGPRALIEATEAIALAAGVSHDRIFSEQFSPA
jgi:ferredoxin-NADP reductase